jgi:hypothetical protein
MKMKAMEPPATDAPDISETNGTNARASSSVSESFSGARKIRAGSKQIASILAFFDRQAMLDSSANA